MFVLLNPLRASKEQVHNWGIISIYLGLKNSEINSDGLLAAKRKMYRTKVGPDNLYFFLMFGERQAFTQSVSMENVSKLIGQ